MILYNKDMERNDTGDARKFKLGSTWHRRHRKRDGTGTAENGEIFIRGWKPYTRKAVTFAEKYGVSKVYDKIDDMFYDDAVDIIYIASPHNTHYAFMEQALLHGKHLLVEKSITLNSRELDKMIALANEKHLLLAEAMTIWHMPLYQKLWGDRKEWGTWKSSDHNHEFRKF